MIRGTRRPGGAGRRGGRIKMRGGAPKKSGWPCLVMVAVGSGLMLTSGAAGLLVWVAR